jgi:cytosine/adenosine deaminase-related metal-dependent hydrolase
LGPDIAGRFLLSEGERVVHFDTSVPTQLAPAPLGCSDCHLEPGHINAHTHIYSGLAPLGMPPPEPPPESFVQILERLWWRLDRSLDESSLRAAARLYAAEALLAGTTTLIDHHESPNFIDGSLDVIADACQELGIRAVLCYGATERNGGRQEAHRGLEECRRFINDNRRPLINGVVALHASFTVSDETIAEAAELCRQLDSVMHVHLAEDLADVEDALDRNYAGPLERLLQFDALPTGSILAHCVHCNESQVQTASQSGVWIVQNPRSNRGNRVGYPEALGAGRLVALGTDGYPACMREEAAALETEAELHGENLETARRRLLGGHDLVAERFGITFSPLARGTAADVVAVKNGRVRHVAVAGQLVVEDGQLVTADFEEIRAVAQEQAPRLWERMQSLPRS